MNFYEKIYEIVRQIPEEKVATYGQIAILAGNPRAARAGECLHPRRAHSLHKGIALLPAG